MRVSCEHGVCGACTVLVDGQTARACLMLAVQQAFWDHHGLQCGYCTPGMLMTAHELLAHNPDPSEAEVREAIAGNLCRCTGYVHIVNAILAAAATMRGAATP